MGLRETRREEQRERIRTAAIGLFELRGYDGATVDAIARAAEVSLPTLFRYFPSKADLLMDRDEALVDRFEQCLREAAPGASLLDVLRTAVLTGGVAVGDSPLGRVRARLAAHPELRRRQLDLDDRAIRRVAAAIARGLALEPTDPRPRVVAAALHALVRSTLETWAAAPAGRSLTEAIDAAIDALPDALGLLSGGMPRTLRPRPPPT